MADKRITVNEYTIDRINEMTDKGYTIECFKGNSIAVLKHEKKPA
jgi:hypothetical protein